MADEQGESLWTFIKGDELYDVTGLGGLTTLGDGTPFVTWVETTWSRLIPGTAPTEYLGLLPAEFVARLSGPVVRHRIVVHDGRPVVDSVQVERRGDEITSKTLSAIPLRSIVDEVVRHIGQLSYFWRLGYGLREPIEMSDRQRAWQIDGGNAAVRLRRRRLLSDDLLREVAQIYQADMTGAPTIAVSEQLFTSHRNATRWVGLAREKGFLPPYGTEEKS